MKTLKKSLCLAGALCMLPLVSEAAQPVTDGVDEKPRVIITCDPELDDLNSLIRFLLYSTDFRVEGLVYASSQFHWKGDGKGTRWYVPGREYSRGDLNYPPMESWRWSPDERFIDDAVDAYEKVYPNLRIHDPAYPTPELLRSKIRIGNVEFDGDMSKDTPGSELIKMVLLDEEPGPVFLNAWGGASTIARALKSIQDIYESTPQWPEIREKVSRKAVLSLSGDQDDTYARYIKPFWPEIRMMAMGSRVVNLSYGARRGASEETLAMFSPEWMRVNVREKGPFGEMYRVWGDGKQMVEGDKFDFFGLTGYTAEELKRQGDVVWTQLEAPGSFLGEGDTFCYLNLIANGLRGHEDPTYGGWCGGLETLPDSVRALPAKEQEAFRLSRYRLPDFMEPVMNGLAARLTWSVTPVYAEANHYPRIEGEMAMEGKPGETLRLKYKITDPDKGDEVKVQWWQYPSSGTYWRQVSVEDSTSANTRFTIPADARPGDTIHLILEATDSGKPQLNHYLRLIITVI